MRVSELTAGTVALFNRIDADAADIDLLASVFLPAAEKHICTLLGITEEEMDEHEDLTLAVCVLAGTMYDNRSMVVDSDKENKTVADIISKYDRNLLPRG